MAEQRKGLRVLVCGGRDYADWRRVWSVLDALQNQHGVACIIHGNATGADAHALGWAKARGKNDLPFRADWSGLGRKAGPLRNQEMLERGDADLVLAFPGGRGTAGMVRLARKAGLEVIEVSDG